MTALHGTPMSGCCSSRCSRFSHQTQLSMASACCHFAAVVLVISNGRLHVFRSCNFAVRPHSPECRSCPCCCQCRQTLSRSHLQAALSLCRNKPSTSQQACHQHPSRPRGLWTWPVLVAAAAAAALQMSPPGCLQKQQEDSVWQSATEKHAGVGICGLTTACTSVPPEKTYQPKSRSTHGTDGIEIFQASNVLYCSTKLSTLARTQRYGPCFRVSQCATDRSRPSHSIQGLLMVVDMRSTTNVLVSAQQLPVHGIAPLMLANVVRAGLETVHIPFSSCIDVFLTCKAVCCESFRNFTLVSCVQLPPQTRSTSGVHGWI